MTSGESAAAVFNPGRRPMCRPAASHGSQLDFGWSKPLLHKRPAPSLVRAEARRWNSQARPPPQTPPHTQRANTMSGGEADAPSRDATADSVAGSGPVSAATPPQPAGPSVRAGLSAGARLGLTLAMPLLVLYWLAAHALAYLLTFLVVPSYVLAQARHAPPCWHGLLLTTCNACAHRSKQVIMLAQGGRSCMCGGHVITSLGMRACMATGS